MRIVTWKSNVGGRMNVERVVRLLRTRFGLGSAASRRTRCRIGWRTEDRRRLVIGAPCTDLPATPRMGRS